MKQGIIFGVILIIVSFFTINTISSMVYTSGDFAIKETQILVKGEEIYSSPLDNYENKIVWVVEEKANRIVLTDREIIEHYNFNLELSDLKTVSNIDYDAINKVSGEGAEINMLMFNEGKVKMYEANCENKECIKAGEISQVNQSIVCAPHQLVVKINGVGDVDV